MTGKGTDARKRLLEEHAKEVFAAKGYSGASISQIVRQAGVARSIFYQYFDNMLHLFESILDSFLHDLHGSVRPVTLGTGDPSPVDQIGNNLTRVLDLVLGERALTRILLAHPGQIDSTVEGRLNCFYEEVHGMIQRSLNLGITMRLVRPCNTGTVADAIIGAVKEVVLQVASGRRSSQPVRDLVRELMEFGEGGIIPANFGTSTEDLVRPNSERMGSRTTQRA